jgi:hypothetical protein
MQGRHLSHRVRWICEPVINRIAGHLYYRVTSRNGSMQYAEVRATRRMASYWATHIVTFTNAVSAEQMADDSMW